MQSSVTVHYELVHNYGIHALKLDYLGLSSVSDLFIVKDRQPYKGLVLTLNGAPSDISDSKKKYINDYYVSYANIVSFPDIWIINPENGHAYKAILCDGSRKDAVSKANAEDAHLVTIASEEEQVWLDEVYEGMEYWTGLKYDVGESRWEWDSGEPFSYMNWDMGDISTPRFADPNAISKDTNNYAILSRKGKWERVREKGTTRMAVIEKDKFKTKSVKDKD